MKKIRLRGLAEGLTGRSCVRAKSVENVFARYPQLKKESLVVINDMISGYRACDG